MFFLSHKKLVMILLLVLVAAGACSKKDEALTPSVLEQEFSMPQGSHTYDATFVDFYNTYQSYVLYRFSDENFRWNGTSWLLYMAKPGDEAYAGKAFDFVTAQCLRYYTPAQLQVILPYKILLSAGIYQLTSNASAPTKYDTAKVRIPVMAGINHVTFGFADPALDTVSAATIKLLKGELHKAFWGYAVARSKVPVPPAFQALFSTTGNSATAYASLGFLEYKTGYTYQLDLQAYIKTITSNTRTELDNSILKSTFDTKGLIKTKYDLVVNYYKENYGVDLQAIGNGL